MFSFAKALGHAALVAGLVGAPFAAASAAGYGASPVPQIAVPSPVPVPGPGPSGDFSGNWRIDQNLYGPYTMTFSLNRYGGGSYQVRGGGLRCNGNLSWHQNGSAVIQLQDSYCGSQTNWSGDELVCQFVTYYPSPPYNGGYTNPYGGYTNPYGGGYSNNNGSFGLQAVPQPNIAVPSQPGYNSSQIRCSYYPSVAGNGAISVLADRTR